MNGCYAKGINIIYAPVTFMNTNIFLQHLDHFNDSIPYPTKISVMLIFGCFTPQIKWWYYKEGYWDEDFWHINYQSALCLIWRIISQSNINWTEVYYLSLFVVERISSAVADNCIHKLLVYYMSVQGFLIRSGFFQYNIESWIIQWC